MSIESEVHPLDYTWCVEAWNKAICQLESMLQSLAEFSQDRGRSMPFDDRFLSEARTVTVGAATKRGVMSWMTAKMDPDTEIIITDSTGYRDELVYRFNNEKGHCPKIYMFSDFIQLMDEVKKPDFEKVRITRVVVVTTEKNIRLVDKIMAFGWVSYHDVTEDIKIIHFI